MSQQRRSFSAQFKFQIALEAARGTKTLSELASQHQVHPNQISQWKRQLLEEGSVLFSRANADRDKNQEALQTDLFGQIGRLKMELEWLKKKATRFDKCKAGSDRPVSSGPPAYAVSANCWVFQGPASTSNRPLSHKKTWPLCEPSTSSI